MVCTAFWVTKLGNSHFNKHLNKHYLINIFLRQDPCHMHTLDSRLHAPFFTTRPDLQNIIDYWLQDTHQFQIQLLPEHKGTLHLRSFNFPVQGYADLPSGPLRPWLLFFPPHQTLRFVSHPEEQMIRVNSRLVQIYWVLLLGNAPPFTVSGILFWAKGNGGTGSQTKARTKSLLTSSAPVLGESTYVLLGHCVELTVV